ncbi:MAG: hypothetical protein DME25_01230 [Verrucomicrobia bacterium]|nr:MAG: hypothetical protein DME25_01230 [Verrucomicrobiota bacterium]
MAGNLIGVDATGANALGNLHGISINAASSNTIGGLATGARNIISANTNDGIILFNAAASGNLIQGNFIGTAVGGTAGLGNSLAGVGLSDAPGNTIGGTAAGAGNLISANGDAGLFLVGIGASGNQIQGNLIGSDATGTLPLGNALEGIYVERAPTNTIGGAASGAANLISANHTRGIFLTNAWHQGRRTK